MSNSCMPRPGTCVRNPPFLRPLLNFVKVPRKARNVYALISENSSRLVLTEILDFRETEKQFKKNIYMF